MKKNIPFTIAVFAALLLTSCATTKETASPEQLAKLEQLVNTKGFHVQARWANPLATRSVNAIASAGLLPPGSSPNRIDIIGTTSYLEMRNDSVFARLPYYGERQFASTYNPADVGIHFKGVPRDLEINFDEREQAYDFSFEIENELGEGFNVNGTLYPNMAGRFYVNSTQRLTIGYSGFVIDKDTP